MRAWKVILIGVIIAVLGIFAMGLGNDPRFIPSPLVGRPAFEINSPALDGGKNIVLSEYRGKWVMVNFWGSWCVSCIREHPALIELAKKLAKRDDFIIFGVDFKDTKDNANRFLERHGDPGYRHVFDPDQRVAIDWGVYGAPESFIVDPEGIVRFKQAGPIYRGWFEKKVLPLLTNKTVGGG